MMSSEEPLSAADWLAATAQATLEMAPALGFEGGRMESEGVELADEAGAFIPMICDATCLQIGFVADRETCQSLAKALLGMEPQDEDLSNEDLADAVSEVVNMFAGGVKARIQPRDPSVKLGLPMFVQGQLTPGGHGERVAAGLSLGPIRGQVVVVCQGTLEGK